ncbi:type II secretion system protein GspK [Thermodesulfatator autotrophicus]|uniref:T2SS protein K first SAM-like domain-containing protein n=1 Tax=Thermodesulfatator autotrophicus TaxID=1795632 RepID=A0A177E934_9BACT|nr:type II secretion system protein GspK [Thermodesulfatator autotrophicus]OAG28216.1 hypothetical protein TH606_02905 [Thermodesulfatator autotrophicus]
MALSFMVGFLFWQGKASQALIQASLNNANIELTRASLLNIFWEEGLSQLKESGFFPKNLNLEIKDTPSIKATFILSEEKYRLNLNEAEEKDIYALLVALDFPPEKAREMVDCLFDWRDPDDFHRLNGAEKDYYLPLGYKPRNGNLEDFSEITLIKGFEPYIFWFKPGLYRRVTIYGGTKEFREDFKSTGDDLIKLHENEVYRLELSLKQGKKTYQYLEIFRYVKGERHVLFSRAW